MQALLDSYEKEVEEIRRVALFMSWSMRGGATYEDILNMSANERMAINTMIEKNMEITKQSGIPYF